MDTTNRFTELKAFDAQYNSPHIAGVDEAGRGPLAGPVVAAAVVLAADCRITGIDDSKKLSPLKRERLFDEIYQKAAAVGIGICDESIIDEINILQATFTAMKMAVDNLKTVPDCLLIDGDKVIPSRIAGDAFPVQNAVVKGDQKSLSIAAASIVAKVTRDRIMEQYDKDYPQYGFSKHKGYSTEEHRNAIRQFGICKIHRKSFSNS